MTTFLIILAVIVGIPVLILVLAGIAAVVDHLLHPHGHEISPELVRKWLQEILDGETYSFDDFTTGGRFKDPRFEVIRKRVAQLDEEFPPTSKGQIFGDDGLEVIRGYIRELEHETAA